MYKIKMPGGERSGIVMRPYQGFWGFREKGHLLSGSWGALANILRDLGSKRGIYGAKEENFQGAKEKLIRELGRRVNFFQGAGSKDPPGRASVIEHSTPNREVLGSISSCGTILCL